MAKMEPAIALARRFDGTLSRINVLIGPVGSQTQNKASAIHVAAELLPGASIEPTASGAARPAEIVSIHA